MDIADKFNNAPLNKESKITHPKSSSNKLKKKQQFDTSIGKNDIVSSREQKQQILEQMEKNFKNIKISNNSYDEDDEFNEEDKQVGGEILEKDSTNIFVKHLPNDFTDEDLAKLFSAYGNVISSKVMIDPKGNSYGYGFVRFSNPNESQAAIKELDGFQFQNKKLLCRLSNLYTNLNSKNPSNNLFIKPLPADVTDEQLRKLFEPYGKIVECKVMLDQNGQSKFAGFVRFFNDSEAASAIDAMNGIKITKDSYPLVVKYADTEQQKVVRKQRKLQTIFQEKIITPPIFPQHFLQQTPTQPQPIIDRNDSINHQNPGYYNYMDYVYLPYHPDYSNPAQYYSQPIQIYHHPHQGTPVYSIFPNSYPNNYYIQQPEIHTHIQPHTSNSNISSPVIPTIQYNTQNTNTNNTKLKGSGGIPNSSTKKKKKKIHQHQASNSTQISVISDVATPLNISSSSIASTNESSTNSPSSPSSIASTNESNTNSPPYTSSLSINSPQSKNSTTTTTTKVIPNDTNLFVFHLPPFIDDAYLFQLFSQYGKLQSVRVITDKDTGENKGYGFVKFYNREDAFKCQKEMNGFRIGSKYLKVKLKNPTTIEKEIALFESNNSSNNSLKNSSGVKKNSKSNNTIITD
ncbi:hypothetical protein DICPUDRAFT_80171 [Dictyostelium purpureum]|uniref:RRM domain-containing protein n=1 Tax=Dictyostelium purpureum TaxID=5786 RepID=F0ZPQ5_DICPU|nr:uncharacterized protein DICPUDRAFT_80171 [Dictyostelium purpureum]EGC34067.1 hypothetical protein DICPUDRAFT_80171 [Dictyostelium purpureum]|eukprot:XP_003289397.1 hypothetical protein DICPUDRAFT_80171 [Dictyostelium purpureum]